MNTKFMLDRSQFGMDKMLSGVEKMVQVELFIGQKTSPTAAAGGHGGDSKKKKGSGKKQSSTTPASELQHVSVKLPKME